MAHYSTPMHRRFRAVTPTANYQYGGALGQTAFYDFEEEVDLTPPSPRRASRPKRKPGRAVKCKMVRYASGPMAGKKRKVCWDKHGMITSNTKPGAKRKGHKVTCKTKCPKGTRRVCTGGYRPAKKGSKKRVCKKYTCKRKR